MTKTAALRIDRVLLDLEVVDAAGVLRAIADDHASSGCACGAGALREALTLRERTQTTALGGGVAIPHARVAGLDRTRLTIVRLKYPVPFGATDGLPVDLLVAILSPVGEPGEHLRLLAAIARRLQDPECVSRMRRASDENEVRAAFDAL